MTFYYRSSDGREFPIWRMIDIDGDEIDDPIEAVLITVREGMSCWTIEVGEGDIIRK